MNASKQSLPISNIVSVALILMNTGEGSLHAILLISKPPTIRVRA